MAREKRRDSDMSVKRSTLESGGLGWVVWVIANIRIWSGSKMRGRAWDSLMSTENSTSDYEDGVLKQYRKRC